MVFNLGFILLFFLPIIESFNRQIAFDLLLIGSLLVSLPTFFKKQLVFDFFELLWLMLLLVFTISSTLSWSLSHSFVELLRYFAYFLIFVSIRRVENKKSLLKKSLIPMILINSFALSILSLIYLIPSFHLALPSSGMNLFYPVFGHNHLSDLLIFTIPVSFISFNKLKDRNKKIIMGYLVGFFIFVMIVTFSRGALLSLSLSFFLYIFLTKNYSFKLVTLILGALTILIFSSSFIFSEFAVPVYEAHLWPQTVYKPIQTDLRFSYLQQAYTGFTKSPIFGTGLDTFRYVSRLYQKEPSNWTFYTHNHYFEIFEETGFLGGLLFFSLITAFLFIAFKNVSPQQGVIFIALIASCFHSFIDFDWQFISIFLIFWITLGVINSINSTRIDKKVYFLPYVFWVTIAILFLFKFVMPLDSENTAIYAENYLKEGKIDEALNALNRGYNLDKGNYYLAQKIAEIYLLNKNYLEVHRWYRQTILGNPMESDEVIKGDYLLYLNQADEAIQKNDLKNASSYINSTLQIYPVYSLKFDGNKYISQINDFIIKKDKKRESKNMSEYIRFMTAKVEKKNLSPQDKLSIYHHFTKNLLDVGPILN